MNLQNKILTILNKLSDPDCVVVAEKEIKALIINEIDDGEKLNILINCISEERDVSNFKNKKSKYNQLKLFISIAEIFQHQILEFLPKMFNKLNKKILTGEIDISEIVSDTYGGIIEFAFKEAEENEILGVFDNSLSELFDIISNGYKNVQQMGAQSITKIIQNCQIDILTRRFQFIYDNLIRILSNNNTKAYFFVLETLLSLLLSVQEKIHDVSEEISQNMMKFLSYSNPKTRKISIDIFYTICAIDQVNTNFHQQLYENLQRLKIDDDKNVREAAMECLKQIKAPQKPTKEKQQFKIEKQNKKSEQESTPHTKNKPKSPKKQKYVSKKMNLDHVKSTIDKKQINKDFMKNHEDNEVEILVKDPPKKIDYDNFYEQNRQQLLIYQENIEIEKPQKFGTIPNFNKTDTRQKHIIESVEPQQNYVVLNSKQQEDFRENKFQSFRNTTPFHDLQENREQNESKMMQQSGGNFNPSEISNLKKYIKVINRKVKGLQENVDELKKENTQLKQMFEQLSNNMNQILMNQQKIPQMNPYQNYLTPNILFAPQQYQQPQNEPPSSSKWIMKSNHQDMNEQLKEILQSNKKDQLLLTFLRSYDHMKKIHTLSTELKSQLLKEIFYQITKYVHEEDFLILDYCIKWLKYFLDQQYPNDIEMMKQLYSILFLVYNSVNEENISDSSDLLLNHPHLLKVYGRSNIDTNYNDSVEQSYKPENSEISSEGKNQEDEILMS